MTNIYEIENRLLVPNWRDFRRTVKIGELGSRNESKINNIDNSKIIFEWHHNKSLGVAADLIGNSFISNDLYTEELKQAIELVEKKSYDASTSLLSLIAQIKEELNPIKDVSNKILEKNIDSIEEFKSIFDNDLLNKIIAKTKNLTKKHISNSVYWIELARLYTIKGQLLQAEKCVQIALHLAPDNRFVLRSATRFFIHIEKEEKALYYLRNTQSIKKDPWLVSAHIASSNLIGRFSPFIKNGRDLIYSKNFSAYDLTELSSSIGSLEIANGSFKKAKPFLELSTQSPNDNSLAQFEWLSKRERRLIFDPKKFKTVKNPFEAFAFENFKNGEFKEAFYNCIDWFLDMPFSKRPLMFASYISTILEEHDTAILLCLIGLRYDNNEIGFLNNLIYNYCLKNDLENAEKYLTSYLPKYNELHLSNELKITLQATIGLFLVRTNQIEEGKMYYKSAIENSTILKNDYYKNQAIINFTRELYLLNDEQLVEYLEKFKEIKTNDKDLMLQIDRVKKEMKKYFP